jgi:hypothetical protein
VPLYQQGIVNTNTAALRDAVNKIEISWPGVQLERHLHHSVWIWNYTTVKDNELEQDREYVPAYERKVIDKNEELQIQKRQGNVPYLFTLADSVPLPVKSTAEDHGCPGVVFLPIILLEMIRSF